MTENRLKKITFRVSDEEYKDIESKCELGISLSNLCRRALGESKVIKLRPKNEVIDHAKNRIFSSISNNINQIAKVLNTAYQTDTISDYAAASTLKKLSDIYDLALYELAISKETYLEQISELNNNNKK